MIFDRLDDLVRVYEEISLELTEPAAAKDQNRFRRLLRERGELAPLVETYESYKRAERTIAESEEMLQEEKDPEMRALLKEELSSARECLRQKEAELGVMLLPKDPNDDKNIVLEIRAGAGGDEAALFAADVYRMYRQYADSLRWKVETLEYSESGIGGANKVTALISGEKVYSRLKFESGVHRVQRIPKTESGGRIHTSTITVAVLPEAEEVEVSLNMDDCRFDVFRASGNGGQCVNTTDSAVRLTHIPTGIVISCQDEKSQLKNRDKALKVLRAKLYELECRKKQDAESRERKNQIGTADRSEKVRTYNFPQGRVTDHRINLTLYRIDSILDGDLRELTDALIAADQARKLSEQS